MTTEPTTPCTDPTCYLRRNPVRHEWLLTFEDRGIWGVADLLWYLIDGEQLLDGEPEDEDDRLDVVDFADFASRHNWGDPALVMSLAHHLEFLYRTVPNSTIPDNVPEGWWR